MTYPSRQDFATTTAAFWQRDAAFWTRYEQRTQAAHGNSRAAAYLTEAMNYKPHQSEY
jgi:hypothetical protein